MHALPVAELDARLQFAARIAGEVGRRLVALRSSGRWPEPGVLGDVGDHAADGYLQGCLLGRYPDDGLLSEETRDDAERLGRRATWIVDPVDGTKEYSTGRHDWAVHVGLAIDGAPVLGAVALPAIDRVLTGVWTGGAGRAAVLGAGGDWPVVLAADAGPGAAAGAGRLRLVVSRSHTPDWVRSFAERLGGAELVPCGSVGFKIAMLLFGKADAYVHDRGLKEWDTCAPEVVARAAGWAVCRFDGSAQRYNQQNPRNEQIVVCRPWLRERVLAGLAALGMR
ncbi:MAG: 3'(2'),5'-bisphosphate nucleotidase CysQ [Planctomycetes bacterium]|nr:3'(2'),5'-bisphosphate nucleotidase CysQ [Planctomycetota bacterium]